MRKKVMNDLSDLVDVSYVTYNPGKIINPFTKKYNNIIFADDVASGRPCHIVDSLMTSNINPYYSNTHSNATCGILMKDMVNKTKDIIREELHLNLEQKIIFSGNGCTGAINHLTYKIDLDRYSHIVIHSSPFEHHSNFLPWNELLKRHSTLYSGISEHRLIDYTKDFESTLDKYISDLETELSTGNNNKRLDILALSGCSNVTGKRFDLFYDDVVKFVKDYQRKGFNVFTVIDYACSAPYIDLDVSRFDACAFSGHKFLGGQTTPGVLIANETLLQIDVPFQPGGGCVNSADDKHTNYKQDKELLEMCGTPNICGIIRLGYVLTIKRSIIDRIHNNDLIIGNFITEKLLKLEAKYPDLKVLGLKSRHPRDLPIFPITIKGLHYNLITVLFNDLFGIQTRGGISCAGTLGRIFRETENVDGWCRISFNYLLTKRQIIKIIKSLEFIIIHGKRFADYYSYDKNKNLFSFKILNERII